MDAAETFANATPSKEPQECVPVLGLASAVACAAAGGLLGWSLMDRKRRLPVLGQVCLGVVAGAAGMVAWQKRQEEIDAARHLIEHVGEVRDQRWLKKHPVAYG